ncbi:hypothetical protein SCUCBS95973_002868 [Sporothrix curviconia]|uniref:Riboflavin kinase n=1 Tax=Sporothrix curviconia TaxID=1260050 RepID=A0ABP0BAM1_9PEZI
MDEKQQQVARQAIQRKPLQRKPLPNLPPANSSDMNRQLPPTPTPAPPTGPPPAYEARPAPGHISATVPEQQIAHMQLNDAAAGVAPPPPPRQGTNMTTATTATASTVASSSSSFYYAPTLASSTRTQSTAATSSTAPALPARPPAGAGQFAPGITASPGPLPPASTMSTAASTSTTTTTKPEKPEKKEPSIWKTALDETRFFAGGLLTKPYESTKHYTVMRHSAGLVMYRGPTTNVVVSVFSTPDHPVAPHDRTVWLQRRGYSGDTGLRLKTLVGASGSWLDVTPERQALPSDLPAADERGYQRDIAKLMKKTSGKHMEKALARRQPRETLVVRIPAACADGYFRLVVCSGGTGGGTGTTKRKVLCGSPVFRVASTSTDASIFRGASLATLPLEAGVKIASFVGSNYVTNAAAPIVETVQGQISKYQPGTVSTLAAQTAYDNSKLATKVDEASQTWDQRREASYQAYSADGDGEGEEDAPPEVLGADSGPTAPFPLQFQGRVVRGTGRSTAECGVPTANLGDVSDDVRLRLRGVYFGWATLVPGKNAAQQQQQQQHDSRFTSDWIEAVVTVGPSPWGPAKTSVVSRNDVVAHLLYDFGTASFVDAQLKVILMGFVRPLPPSSSSSSPSPPTKATDGAAADASLVVSSLSRPAWGPQATLARMASDKSSRSLSDKYADTRGKLQKQVDRIPVHWAGVRTEAGDLRDQLYGNGGFWVKR